MPYFSLDPGLLLEDLGDTPVYPAFTILGDEILCLEVKPVGIGLAKVETLGEVKSVGSSKIPRVVSRYSFVMAGYGVLEYLPEPLPTTVTTPGGVSLVSVVVVGRYLARPVLGVSNSVVDSREFSVVNVEYPNVEALAGTYLGLCVSKLVVKLGSKSVVV